MIVVVSVLPPVSFPFLLLFRTSSCSMTTYSSYLSTIHLMDIRYLITKESILRLAIVIIVAVSLFTLRILKLGMVDNKFVVRLRKHNTSSNCVVHLVLAH